MATFNLDPHTHKIMAAVNALELQESQAPEHAQLREALSAATPDNDYEMVVNDRVARVMWFMLFVLTDKDMVEKTKDAERGSMGWFMGRLHDHQPSLDLFQSLDPYAPSIRPRDLLRQGQ